jgi:eukaryotic-like serine/threonine-protein kinase
MARFGDYELVEKIGEGGMAMVYKGVQASLGRAVAIKVLSRTLTDDAEIVERFNRESVIIARLNHPNIIHVIDRGIADGVPYFAMDFVDGTDLARVIAEERYDFRQKFDVIVQVCKALAYAHRNGVIHLDIKPANILIDGEGNALVSDFGIAHLFGAGDVSSSALMMGTPNYMSPEQKNGVAEVSSASDIYSLGVLMYELFTGRKPVAGVLPSAIDARIPRRLDQIIVGCLRNDPADRFPSAEAVRDALLGSLQGAHLSSDSRQHAVEGLQALKDRFALLDVLKERRNGAVYLFENRATRQLLVIKKLVGRRAGLAEARLLTGLKHRNVVNVSGTSTSGRISIIVMEYMAGGSLKDRLAGVPSWEEALPVLRGVCEGLSFLHRNRIVHGNLRPANVLFGADGDVRLSDVGLDDGHDDDTAPRNAYAPPREAKSPRADIFAAGMMFSELLTGELPVEKKGQMVHDYSLRWLPLELRQLIARMVACDPAQRPQGMDEILDELDELGRTAEVPSTPSHGARPQSPFAPRSALSKLTGAVGSLVRSAFR